MSLPDDLVHSLHGRQPRASKDGQEDDGARCDAKIAAAEESDGVYHSGQEELLHIHLEYHPGRSRSYGCTYNRTPYPMYAGLTVYDGRFISRFYASENGVWPPLSLGDPQASK